MDIEILKLKAYVEISKYRVRIIKALSDDVKMPSQLARECDISVHHISNYLRNLKEHDLIECINEEVRKGRLYRLTENGIKVEKMMK